jgi:hypothetical protein
VDELSLFGGWGLLSEDKPVNSIQASVGRFSRRSAIPSWSGRCRVSILGNRWLGFNQHHRSSVLALVGRGNDLLLGPLDWVVWSRGWGGVAWASITRPPSETMFHHAPRIHSSRGNWGGDALGAARCVEAPYFWPRSPCTHQLPWFLSTFCNHISLQCGFPRSCSTKFLIWCGTLPWTAS